MIKVFTNDFRCDMMKKATGLQKGSRCLFYVLGNFVPFRDYINVSRETFIWILKYRSDIILFVTIQKNR